MSEISSLSDYTNKYNTRADLSALFGSTSDTGPAESSNPLTDFAALRNGSYKKLLKAYYAKQDAEKLSGSGDSPQKSQLIRTSADALKKAADALNSDSLWEKKKIRKKDEGSGNEIELEDYDRDAITRAVKDFVDAYNDMVEEAGASDTKGVLRSAVWMTGMTEKNSKMLAKLGITIGKGNKLELDEEALKKAEISSLKTAFSGYNSFAAKVAQKAADISGAAARAGTIYTSRGAHSRTLSALAAGKVDEKA